MTTEIDNTYRPARAQRLDRASIKNVMERGLNGYLGDQDDRQIVARRDLRQALLDEVAKYEGLRPRNYSAPEIALNDEAALGRAALG